MKKFFVLFLVLVNLTVGANAFQVSSSRQNQIWNAVDDCLITYADEAFDDGEFTRVVSALRFRLAIHPNDSEVLTDLGWMLENTSRAGEALSLYISYRQRNASDTDAALPEITYYFRKKAYAKIPPIAEPELARTPTPNLYRMLYSSYEMIGLLSDAVRVLDLYLGRFPDDPTAKMNRERISKKMRQPLRR